MEKIKEYTAEVYEKETKRTIIHETIKEKGIRVKAKETTIIKFDKLSLIRELSGQKIDLQILKAVANRMGEHIPNGKGFELYDQMSEKMLEYLNRIFVEQELDSEGRFIEFRTADFIKQKYRTQIKRVEIRPRFDKIGEIDVVGFDSEDKPLVMAECKGKRPIKDEMAKWLENTRRVFHENDKTLIESYFVTSNKLTPENLKYIEDCEDVDAKKGQLMTVRGIIERGIRYLKDDKSPSESGKVYLSIYEVRKGEYTKIFPRK